MKEDGVRGTALILLIKAMEEDGVPSQTAMGLKQPSTCTWFG
jgi:hypothetical protein